MAQKHTPGPWSLEIGERHCFHEGNRVAITSEHGCDEGNATIAEVWAATGDADIADGHLIAAAPDLLAEAVELMRNAIYDDGYAVVLTQDCEALEAAIAKARGEG